MNSFDLTQKSARDQRPAIEALENSPLGPTAERHSAVAEIVLFLLDLARVTGEASFLEVARLAAEYLAEGWNKTETCKWSRCAEWSLNLAHPLSRSAFALAEAWKITQDPMYRDAGLNIIRYLSGMEITLQSVLDPCVRADS